MNTNNRFAGVVTAMSLIPTLSGVMSHNGLVIERRDHFLDNWSWPNRMVCRVETSDGEVVVDVDTSPFGVETQTIFRETGIFISVLPGFQMIVQRHGKGRRKGTIKKIYLRNQKTGKKPKGQQFNGRLTRDLTSDKPILSISQ